MLYCYEDLKTKFNVSYRSLVRRCKSLPNVTVNRKRYFNIFDVEKAMEEKPVGKRIYSGNWSKDSMIKKAIERIERTTEQIKKLVFAEVK